jgi:hypothetical protein
LPYRKTSTLHSQLVLSAKTVYIDNQSGYSQVADRAYDELTKWGRFKVVDSPTKADLVLRFTADTTPGSVGRTSTYDSKSNTWKYGTVRTGGDIDVHFWVLDPTSGDTLWSASKSKAFRSQSRGDIKELKSRIDEQEKLKP